MRKPLPHQHGCTTLTKAECARIERLHKGGHTIRWIAEVMRRNEGTISRCVRRGYRASDRREAQASVPATFKQVCRDHSIENLARMFGHCKETIRQWIAEVDPDRPSRKFVKGRVPTSKRPLPEGFADYYRAHGWKATAKHFGVDSGRTMMRLMKVAGIEPKRPRRQRQDKPQKLWVETYQPANDATPPMTERGYVVMRQRAERARAMA